MINHSPLFSVIIPTYNRAYLISKTIDSVLAQTFTDFEVIIVDDGSTDNTHDVVSSYSDERIKYILQKNSERAAARNNGIHKAKGLYVTFLDSDDLFMQNHLEVVRENLLNLSFPFFFHQAYQIEHTKENRIELKTPPRKNPLKVLIKKGNFFGCAGLFLRKELAEKHLFDEERILSGSEDYVMLLRLTMYESIIVDKKPTTRLINHEGRGELNINKQKLIERIEYLTSKCMANEEFVARYKSWIPAFKFSNYSFVALHLSNHKEKKDAFKFLIKALKKSPTSLFSKRALIIIYCILFR